MSNQLHSGKPVIKMSLMKGELQEFAVEAAVVISEIPVILFYYLMPSK
jgi:hypothetical protein